jgi:hypothetical protein
MANYDISNCLLGNPIVFTVSATTLSIGDSVRVNQNETEYCGIVIGESSFFPDSVLMDENLLGCCDCLQNSYSALVFRSCTGDDIFVDIINFCDTYGSPPTFNTPYWRLFNTGTSEVICAEFIGVSNDTSDISWIPDNPGPFDSCPECLSGIITYSSGTEYNVCVICEDCCASGTTATTVNPPHPTWTRPNGDAVVLLDAVQLGGMFGLNS